MLEASKGSAPVLQQDEHGFPKRTTPVSKAARDIPSEGFCEDMLDLYSPYLRLQADKMEARNLLYSAWEHRGEDSGFILFLRDEEKTKMFRCNSEIGLQRCHGSTVANIAETATEY